MGSQDPGGELRLDRGAPGHRLRGLAPAGEVVGRLFRAERGRAVATLIRLTGDFDVAEEAVQEAFVVALERWPQAGLPDNPAAWIMVTARNRAIDRLRANRKAAEGQQALASLAALEADRDAWGAADAPPPPDAFPDDRLRLVFT
ncbi:MAG: sigma factor, partial [Actinomycetota bacterium]